MSVKFPVATMDKTKSCNRSATFLIQMDMFCLYIPVTKSQSIHLFNYLKYISHDSDIPLDMHSITCTLIILRRSPWGHNSVAMKMESSVTWYSLILKCFCLMLGKTSTWLIIDTFCNGLPFILALRFTFSAWICDFFGSVTWKTVHLSPLPISLVIR